MMRFLLSLVLLFSGLVPLCAQQITSDSFQKINSGYDERNPVLSPDGRRLYFTIANHVNNTGSEKDPGDIWYADWQGNQWSDPVHAGRNLNDRAFNAVAGFSPDGKEMFLLSHYDASGNMARTQGIAVSKNTGNGWGKPENIFIPYFHNKSNIITGSMSADNHVLLFSAETYGTHGVEDIYVSVKENGRWTQPVNLGPVINTQFQELSPSLSDDGKTLYYSSNGRKGGMGSFDVYASTRLDDSWRNWSDPVNIGGDINSDGRELCYRYFPQFDFAIYTSTKNSDGYGDLKFFKKQDTPLATNATNTVLEANSDPSLIVTTPVDTATSGTIVQHDPVETPSKVEGLPEVVKIYGVVKNSKNGQPVNATVYFAGPKLPNQQIATESDSGYSVLIPSYDSYTIKIEAPGYISALEKLDIHTYDQRELEMNFTLQPVEVGTTVNLKSVLFVQTKTELLPESYDELDLVVSFLNKNPQVKIELSGHTDNRGVHTDNVRLSQQRVNAVKTYLVSKGIDGKRISGKGYGGTRPIASNETEETRKMNRRVEFTIKKF